MSTSAVPSGAGETKVVDEIPETLNQILLMMVKNFFSNEHFIVVYHIMRAECIREENLRARIGFDQKQLRQLLASLKSEKLVKERLLQQKNDNNKNVTLIFYFINYRAVLNVLKYKIDHMRQKLESREKNDSNKAHFKCSNTNCGSSYDTLEVTTILDPTTGSLTCWRCHGEVLPDESAAPSNLSRNAVARFNEQMTPLFSRIQELHGIQLAPHLLEPDITKFMEDDKELQLQQQSMDFTSNGPGGRVALGATAHSYQSASTLNYQHGDQITVDLNADINNRPVEEAKQVPEWLKDTAIVGGAEDSSHNEQILSLSQVVDVGIEEVGKSDNVEQLLAEVEGSISEPEAKKSKEDETKKDEEDDEEYEDEEEEMVQVGGKKIPLSEVTTEMVEHEMSDEERQKYTELIQELHGY